MPPKKSSLRFAGKLVRAGVLTVFTTLLAFPFYWMIITSFKQNVDLYTMENNPFLFNASPTLAHLKFLFTETRFVRWLGNTAFVGIIVVLAGLILLIVPLAVSEVGQLQVQLPGLAQAAQEHSLLQQITPDLGMHGCHFL